MHESSEYGRFLSCRRDVDVWCGGLGRRMSLTIEPQPLRRNNNYKNKSRMEKIGLSLCVYKVASDRECRLLARFD